MKTVISSLESTAESLLKLAGVALKLSIGLGSACVIIYALRVGHFPQGLTLGDGLLFLLAASCFGIVYAMFVGCLVSLGVCFAIVIRPVFNFIYSFVKRKTGFKKTIPYELAPFHWGAIPFALLAALLVWGLGRHDNVAYWNLPLLSVVLYFFYSVVKDAGAKYRSHERFLNTVIETPEKDALRRSGDAGKAKNAYLICLSLVMVTPLLMGGVSGQLMDGAMRMAQVRTEHATVYIKSPYNALMPDASIAKEIETPDGFKAYSDVIIQFKGFGSTTVIAFMDAKLRRQLDIPNDHIIVEKDI